MPSKCFGVCVKHLIEDNFKQDLVVIRNTCYSWVCLVFPWCYGCNCLLTEFTFKGTTLCTHCRPTMREKFMTSKNMHAESFIIWLSARIAGLRCVRRTFFTEVEVNIHHFRWHWGEYYYCFSIYHTSWIISRPKGYFMRDKWSEILKSLAPAARRWIVLSNHLRVVQSERAKSAILLCGIY